MQKCKKMQHEAVKNEKDGKSSKNAKNIKNTSSNIKKC